MGKNARQWEYLSHHWTSQRARKQVLKRGCRGISHISLPLWRNIGTQLDELLPVKNCSCSTLTAYATLCSILLPSALYKKYEKSIKMNERRIQNISPGVVAAVRQVYLVFNDGNTHSNTSVRQATKEPQSQPPHDLLPNLPLLPLPSPSLSC